MIPRATTDPDALARRMRLIGKVRKLLRLAEDQAGRPEGDVAAQRAREMMAAHGLQGEGLDLSEVAIGYRSIPLARGEAWRQMLARLVAEYLDCVALHEAGSDLVQVWGPEPVLQQVAYVIGAYLHQLRRSWREHADALQVDGAWSRLGRAGQLRAREDFCVSFVIGVQQRLEQERAAEPRDAVAARAARHQARKVERWMGDQGVKWRRGRAEAHTLSWDGFQAGMEAEVEPALRGSRGTRQLIDGA